jgi:hypothetical protein
MIETPPLRPASVDEIVEALSFALRYQGRKRVYQADDAMARITAERLVQHLRQCGFVLMRAPPAAAPTTAIMPPSGGGYPLRHQIQSMLAKRPFDPGGADTGQAIGGGSVREGNGMTGSVGGHQGLGCSLMTAYRPKVQVGALSWLFQLEIRQDTRSDLYTGYVRFIGWPFPWRRMPNTTRDTSAETLGAMWGIAPEPAHISEGYAA